MTYHVAGIKVKITFAVIYISNVIILPGKHLFVITAW